MENGLQGITYCNLALENIPGVDMDELEKNALLGEAQFLRAYWYFNLVTTFGRVPLVTRSLAPSEYAQPQAEEDADLDPNRLRPRRGGSQRLKRARTAPPRRDVRRVALPMRSSQRHTSTRATGPSAAPVAKTW